MPPILEIKNVSKKYTLQGGRQPYLSIRDSLAFFFSKNSKREDFWALNDVSFNVNQGDCVGIIGRNGAGKSTLLKVLSKITPPTSGKIISRGRIASLLEVGTGFHPELTGKENVYLNGSILGLKKREIEKQFDAIVEFSGVERFLNTPLKHYSSGMQLRLAFSVAAFLEPEILVIDEVLAVGDSEFQRKCIKKMDDVSKSGRTILFVSHNMGSVRMLCNKGIYMKSGKVESIGEISEVINTYTLQTENEVASTSRVFSQGIIQSVDLLCDDQAADAFYMGCNLKIRVQFKSPEPIAFPVLGVIIKDSYGIPIIGINNKHYSGNIVQNPVSEGTIIFEIESFTVINGNYRIDIRLGDFYKELLVLEDVLSVEVGQAGISDNAMEFPLKELNKFYFKKVNWTVNGAR